MRQRNFFDIFFSLSLMSVFVLCSACVLVFQIDRFEQTKLHNETQENQRLAQSYITMSFHQRGASTSVEVVEIMGVDCFTIKDNLNDTTRFIYVYDGYLRELYQSQQANIDLAIGDKIAAVSDMSISKEDKLYTFAMSFDEEVMDIQLATY